MWVAVNRVNALGEVMAPAEALTPQQALQAVTLNAAKILGIERETGSLRAGKRADITVLSEHPLEVEPMLIRDIEVVAIMFEGKVRMSTEPH